MNSIMIKLRRRFRFLGVFAIFAFAMTSLGLMAPAQAAPPAVAPASSIASIQTALVTTPERVMVSQNPNATLYASPYIKDAWGGKWGKTCRYDTQYIGFGKWRYYEVRQNNYWFNQCTRTGYAVDSAATKVYVIWYY